MMFRNYWFTTLTRMDSILLSMSHMSFLFSKMTMFSYVGVYLTPDSRSLG